MAFGQNLVVGVDCDDAHLRVGFVTRSGLLKGLSTTASPLVDHPETFGERLYGMVRGLRGDENVRMRNFRAVGIGIPGRYLAGSPTQEIIRQLKAVWDIPVYLADRETLAPTGRAWLAEVASLLDPRVNPQALDLGPVYGAAKLAVESLRQG